MWCGGTVGRAVGWSVYGHVTTNFLRWVDYFIFLPMVPCWCDLHARAVL